MRICKRPRACEKERTGPEKPLAALETFLQPVGQFPLHRPRSLPPKFQLKRGPKRTLQRHSYADAYKPAQASTIVHDSSECEISLDGAHKPSAGMHAQEHYLLSLHSPP
jgi:hypothetical protein